MFWPICIAIITLSGIFSDRLICKINICCYKIFIWKVTVNVLHQWIICSIQYVKPGVFLMRDHLSYHTTNHLQNRWPYKRGNTVITFTCFYIQTSQQNCMYMYYKSYPHNYNKTSNCNTHWLTIMVIKLYKHTVNENLYNECCNYM